MRSPGIFGLVFLALGFGVQPAFSAALKIAPIRILLGAHNTVQVMRIENTGSETTRLQLQILSWSQRGGRDYFAPTRDVLANPAMFEIAPHKIQIVRIGLRTKAGAMEKSYRLFVVEVPNSIPQSGRVQTLLRISVPVFVPAPNAVGRLVWHAWPSGPNKLTLSLQNVGNAHTQIHHITLDDGTHNAPLGVSNRMLYLLPGTHHEITIPINGPAKPGQSVELKAATDGPEILATSVIGAPFYAENGD